MKIAIGFLLLSLSCCFTLPVDKKDEPAAPVPKPVVKPEPKVPETEPKPVPKEQKPVPKEQKPVPKEPKPVPKQPQPVPKQPQPVPKQPQPIPQQPQPVPKQPQPVPKQPQPVPKQPQPIPQQPQPIPQQPQPIPQPPQPIPQQPKPAPKPVPKIDCLVQLLKKDAPALLKNLGTLLCNYQVAQTWIGFSSMVSSDYNWSLEAADKNFGPGLVIDRNREQRQQNVAYFISYLEQVDNILKGVGCTLSNLLGTSVTINTQDAAALANEVSLILFNFLQDIIERVVKVLDDIPILRDFINDTPLTSDVRDLACSVLNHYLTKIADILIVIADITGGLTQIIEGL